MRLAFALLFAATSLATPLLGGAADLPTTIHPLPTPAPLATRVMVPEVRALPSSPPVSGPPSNPTTPTLWVKMKGSGKQVLMSNVSESMTPVGSKGCLRFAITASLNAGDAITLLQAYTQNQVLANANVYAPPVAYLMENASITTYSESDGPSGATVHMSLIAQHIEVTSGTPGQSTGAC